MLNNISLMGRLTADPEKKQTASGISVTSFSIAVERNYSSKETGKREADFITIVAFRGTADIICKYFSKGKLIALQGSFQSRKYEDKNKNKHTIVEVIAEQVFFIEKKNANNDVLATDDIAEIFNEPPVVDPQAYYEQFDMLANE